MVPEYLDIPIFPLPNVTLFPKTVLPLHIFESRYREMAEACLNGDRLIGVPLLREGWQKDYFGEPPIHKIFGVGKVCEHERLDDGRFNLIVEGMYRVRLITEYPTEPYRTARTFVLQDQRLDDRRNETTEVREELFAACRELSKILPKYSSLIQGAWAIHPHPGIVVDSLASTLVLDAYDRQSILEESDPIRRMKLVNIQVRRILHEIEQGEIEAEAEIDPDPVQKELFEED